MDFHSTHTLHLQHHWSGSHLESDRRSVVELFCGKCQRVKTQELRRRSAMLLMLGHSVLGGFHHWGNTKETLTPSTS